MKKPNCIQYARLSIRSTEIQRTIFSNVMTINLSKTAKCIVKEMIRIQSKHITTSLYGFIHNFQVLHGVQCVL